MALPDSLRERLHPLMSWLTSLQFQLAEAWCRLTGRESMLPPAPMLFIGNGNLETIGTEFRRHLVGLAGLTPDQHVLDVGCGLGRIAVPLTAILSPRASYLGIDGVDNTVRWCRRRISARHPNFRFEYADVYNRYYNPRGRQPADQYRFPLDDASVDLVVLVSVFTHMLPDAMVQYLSESARVLKPGGRMFATLFLLNAESKALMQAGRSGMRFDHRLTHPLADHAVLSRSAPEHAVAYDEDRFIELARERGLVVRIPIHPGAWCGRSTFYSFQDICIADKLAA